VAERRLQVGERDVRGLEQRANTRERIVVRIGEQPTAHATPQIHVAAHDDNELRGG
jgi:hypothetical protein